MSATSAPLTPMSRARSMRGSIAMVSAMGFFILNDALVKLATVAYPTGQVLAVRGVMATFAALALVRMLGPFSDLRQLARPIVIGRGLLEGIVAFTFILALSHLPLANITAILQAASLIVVALAGVLGIDRIGWRRWLAIFVGFIGVLLIVRPAADGFTIYSVVALVSASLVAVRDLVTRRIGADISSGVVTFATTLIVCLVGFCLGLVEQWQPLRLRETLYLVGAAGLVAAGNYAIIVAFRDGDVAVVSALRYSVVLFALILGVIVWGDWPDAQAIVGAGLIVGSGLYALHRQRVRARETANRA